MLLCLYAAPILLPVSAARPQTQTCFVLFCIAILHCGGGLVLNSMCQLVALGTIGLLCLRGEDEK